MTPTDLPRVLALSARDPEYLAALRGRLAAWLENTPDTDLDDLSLTLWAGRERFPCRDAVTGTSVAEVVARLKDRPTNGVAVPREPGDGPVLLLDGPPLATVAGVTAAGSPRPGGTEPPFATAAVGLPEVTDALRLAEDVCRTGGDLAAARDVAVRYAVVAWLRARGVRAGAVRGTGLGVFAAAAARGDLSLTDALRAAASGTPATDEAPDADEGLAAGPTEAPVVRIGPRRPDTTGALHLDPADGASYARLLAELWRHGYDVDTALGRAGRRIRLPGHPFRRREPGGPRPADEAPTRPLTPYEQRWLFYDLVRHGSSGDHTVAVAAVVPGPPPEPAALHEAFAELQRRHPALRTVFAEPGGRWQARTLPDPAARPDRPVHDPDGGPQQLRESVLDAARRPLPLRDAPLVRCCLHSGPEHWAPALAVYEPLTTTVDPQHLLDELLGLLGAEAPPAQPLPA